MHYVGVVIACLGSFVYNNISEDHFGPVKRKVGSFTPAERLFELYSSVLVSFFSDSALFLLNAYLD